MSDVTPPPPRIQIPPAPASTHDIPRLPPHDETDPRQLRRVVLSSFLGTTIEFYDFLLYGSAAALVFGPLFFSGLSGPMATIASFATFATGFVVRPIGGIVFGHLGDRAGRKNVLLITMMIMGLASGAIGLLPTYDQIGVIAPILLITLRLVQGFAVGGEWGGATLMAAEHANPKHRGFISSIPQIGLAVGGLLATTAMLVVSVLPREELLSWAWRIPFLVSFVIFAIGVFVRLKVSESPLYQRLAASEGTLRSPLATVVNRYWRPLLRGTVIASVPVIVPTLFGSWALTYAVEQGFSRSTALAALCAAWIIDIPTMMLFGLLGDRHGRRPIFFCALTAFIVTIYPCFLALQSQNPALLFTAFIWLFSIVSTSMVAGVAALLPELFPTDVRNSGVSLTYQGGSVIAGFTPLLASILITQPNGVEWISAVIIAVSVVALGAVWATHEGAGQSLAVDVST